MREGAIAAAPSAAASSTLSSSLLRPKRSLTWASSACTASVVGTLVMCTLLAALAARFLSAPPVDLLFVLHDAGESYALERTIDTLARDGGLRIAVLALGQPARDIFAGRANVSVHTPAELGVTTRILDGEAYAQTRSYAPRAHALSRVCVPLSCNSRNATLTDVDVALLLAHFGRPSVLVAGMVYKMQAQLARAFRSRVSASKTKNCYAIGVDDAIGHPWTRRGDHAMRRDFLGPPTTEIAIDELFVADRPTAKNASAYIDAHLPKAGVTVTLAGSGSIEEWKEKAANVTLRSQAREAMVRMPQASPCTPPLAMRCLADDD